MSTYSSAQPPVKGPGADRRRAVLVIIAVLAVVGLVVGLIWPHLAPRVDMVMLKDIGPYPLSEEEAGQLMEMDAWYAVLGAGAALLTGAVLGAMYIRFGLTTVAAVLVGSILAAGLVLVVGSLSSGGEVLLAWKPEAPVAARLTAPLMLHAYGVLLVWPIAALAPLLPLAWLGWEDGNLTNDRAVSHGEPEG